MSSTSIQQVSDKIDALIAVLDNPYVTWATVATAVAAVGFGIWNFFELRRQRKAGLSLKIIDPVGNGIIENNSQSDYTVRLTKHVITEGACDQNARQAPAIVIKILKLLDKKSLSGKNPSKEIGRKIRQMMEGRQKGVVIEQQLAPSESIRFHIHDLSRENISVAFIMLEFTRDNRRSFFLYRFASRPNGGKIPADLQYLCQPWDQWVRVLGFNE